MRILKWVVERANGQAGAIESPIGWMPRYEDLDWRGLDDFARERFGQLMSVDRDVWARELLSHEELFSNLYDRLPKEMIFVRQLLLSALFRSPELWQIGGEADLT
jgi:phosphoenolpyruvate carboxykinase (GTP)